MKSNIAGEKARKRVKTQKKSLKPFIILCILVFFAFLSALSPVFNLRDIWVTGVHRYPSEDIINATGMVKGENIFKINHSKIKKKMLKTFPYIETMDFKWVFFNIYDIKITEREPVARAEYMGSYVLMDKNGYLLEIKNRNEDAGLPVVKGMQFKHMELSEKLADDNNTRLKTALDIIESLNKYRLLKETNVIDVNDIKEIHLKIRSGILINFENTDNLDYRMNYLYHILNKLDKGAKGYIDFSTGQNPIFKPQTE